MWVTVLVFKIDAIGGNKWAKFVPVQQFMTKSQLMKGTTESYLKKNGTAIQNGTVSIIKKIAPTS